MCNPSTFKDHEHARQNVYACICVCLSPISPSHSVYSPCPCLCQPGTRIANIQGDTVSLSSYLLRCSIQKTSIPQGLVACWILVYFIRDVLWQSHLTRQIKLHDHKQSLLTSISPLLFCNTSHYPQVRNVNIQFLYCDGATSISHMNKLKET